MKTEKVLLVAGVGGIAYWLWTKSRNNGASVLQKRQWLIQYVQKGGDTPETIQKATLLFGQTMTDVEINIVYKVLYDFTTNGIKPSAALQAQFNAIGEKYNIFT